MANGEDLIGLGFPHFLSRMMGGHNDVVSSQGSTIGSATPLLGGYRHYLVTASNSGSGLKMPQVGGDIGVAALRGDMWMLTNLLSASVVLYFANTVKGSAVTIYVDGGSVVGTTGVSVAAGKPLLLRPISASTWVGLRSA